jgi:hypothetical protein
MVARRTTAGVAFPLGRVLQEVQEMETGRRRDGGRRLGFWELGTAYKEGASSWETLDGGLQDVASRRWFLPDMVHFIDV